MSRDRSPLGQLIIGATILFVGLLWTLDSMNLVETDEIIRWWPLGLVVLGGLKLFGLGMQRAPVAGLLLAGFGLGFTLDTVGVLNMSMRLFWPVVIMSLGGILVARSMGWMGGPIGAVGPGAGSMAFMGGVVHREPADTFQGGAATAVMGGVDYDLTSARGVEPGGALDILAFWGGIDLAVPPGWRLDMKVTALLGGIHDTRSPVPVDSNGPTLVVRGLVVMGGLEIKDRLGP
ncbi:MAG: hypothetical protein SGI90_14590 [Candidatus Eisenbacteria bacterium]|nr:hypothetical protein [Candidatus Eisenbacteria bacterium]